jgi:hypothetical protein
MEQIAQETIWVEATFLMEIIHATAVSIEAVFEDSDGYGVSYAFSGSIGLSQKIVVR